MKKLLWGMTGLVLLAVLAAAGAYGYIQPARPLDLAYSELPLRSKLADMIVRRKPEVELTEPEVNSLLKRAIAAHPLISSDVEITGAQFTLQGSQWVADVNLLYRQWWKIGATLYFDVAWDRPYLTATHTQTRIKQAQVPVEWFRLNPIQLTLNDYVPKPAGIRDVAFLEHGVRIGLTLR